MGKELLIILTTSKTVNHNELFCPTSAPRLNKLLFAASDEALANPYDEKVSISKSFIRIPILKNMISDQLT